jgi:outer membrane protein assembly factor BamC
VLVEQDFDVPRPQPLSAGAAEQVVRIQSLGDESWALIAVAPGQLWPQVRGFLSAAGVQVARVDASDGIMETGWVALQDAQMESRFRFRIDRGVQRGTSELHVLQQNRAGDVMAWPPASDDLGQEGEMLRSVAQYIANSTESAPVSMIADRAISASGRISLQEADEGYTYIELGLPFNRAWASLAIALEDAYFEITDQDRSAGRYYVTFIGEQEEDSGWFDWFGSDEHPLSGRRMLVTVTPESEEVMRIRLLSDQGEPELALRDEQGLLSMIKGNIN